MKNMIVLCVCVLILFFVMILLSSTESFYYERSSQVPLQFKLMNEEPDNVRIHKPIEDIIPVVICVNYDDFLAITLESNRKMFKDYIVITSPEDRITQELCKKYNVDCRIYQDFYKNAKFNKSGAIHWVQRDIHMKHPNKWILMLDSDIILPKDFPEWADPTFLDKDAIYGVARKNYDTSTLFKKKIGNFADELPGFGYFQLYFDKNMYYPPFSESARECDEIFLKSFEKQYYITLKRYVYHLGYTFTNHDGRVSIRWE